LFRLRRALFRLRRALFRLRRALFRMRRAFKPQTIPQAIVVNSPLARSRLFNGFTLRVRF
jgi:hypothetical protein